MLFFSFSIVTDPEVADYYCRLTLPNKRGEGETMLKVLPKVQNVRMSKITSG